MLPPHLVLRRTNLLQLNLKWPRHQHHASVHQALWSNSNTSVNLIIFLPEHNHSDIKKHESYHFPPKNQSQWHLQKNEAQSEYKHVFANISRSRYVAIAMQLVHWLQICPIVHN